MQGQIRELGAGEGCFFEDFLFIGKGVLELCVNDSGSLELFSLGVFAGQRSRCWRGLFF